MSVPMPWHGMRHGTALPVNPQWTVTVGDCDDGGRPCLHFSSPLLSLSLVHWMKGSTSNIFVFLFTTFCFSSALSYTIFHNNNNNNGTLPSLPPFPPHSSPGFPFPAPSWRRDGDRGTGGWGIISLPCLPPPAWTGRTGWMDKDGHSRGVYPIPSHTSPFPYAHFLHLVWKPGQARHISLPLQ